MADPTAASSDHASITTSDAPKVSDAKTPFQFYDIETYLARGVGVDDARLDLSQEEDENYDHVELA